MRELIFAYLSTRPEYAKPKSCRRKLVGPMRSYLWRHGEAQDGQWPDAPAHALTLIAERAGASEMLADFCARCGRCAWSENSGVMKTPAELRVLSPHQLMTKDTDPDADHGR